jgi:hypothetical protein
MVRLWLQPSGRRAAKREQDHDPPVDVDLAGVEAVEHDAAWWRHEAPDVRTWP